MDALNSGIGGLAEFGSMLSTTLGSFDKNLAGLKHSSMDSKASIADLKKRVSTLEAQIKFLEDESVDQRSRVETVSQNIFKMNKTVDGQLAEVAQQIQRDISEAMSRPQKVDIHTLTGDISRPAKEAIRNLSRSRSTRASIDFNPTGSTQETIEYLTERVKLLEEGSKFQEDVNEKLNASVSKQNNVIYDRLLHHISSLEHELSETKDDCKKMKEEFTEQLKRLRDGQKRQEVFIFQLREVSKGKLKKLRKMNRSLSFDGRFRMDTRTSAGSEVNPVEDLNPSNSNFERRQLPDEGNREEEKKKIEEIAESKAVPMDSGVDNIAYPKHDEKKIAEHASSDHKQSSEFDGGHSGKITLSDEKCNRSNTEQEKSNVSFDDSDTKLGIIDGYDDLSMGSDTGYGEDSLESDGELRSKLEAAYRRAEATQQQVAELKMIHGKRLDDAELLLMGMRKMQFVMDEMKTQMDAIKRKDDKRKGNTLQDHLIMEKNEQVGDLGGKLGIIQKELLFGLENANLDFDDALDESEYKRLRRTADWDGDDNNPATMLHHASSEELRRDGVNMSKLFFAAVKKFLEMLDESLEEFTPRDLYSKTLEKLGPKLELIYRQGKDLLDMDDHARKMDGLAACFDDLLCSDLVPNLKGLVEDAVSQSGKILEDLFPKVELLKRIERLEAAVDTKCDASEVIELEQDLKSLVSHKVDQNEFLKISGKQASLSELQRLKSQVVALASGGVAGGNAVGTVSLIDIDDASLKEDRALVKDLSTRFELLARQNYDLQSVVDRLAPKDEVHHAMKALIGELKMMKKNFVTQNVFKEGLKLKADLEEVER